jgi:hypothetical protein
VSADEPVHVGAATLRRVAWGLTVYGAVGIVLLTTALIGGWNGIARIDSTFASAAQARATLDTVADGFDAFDVSLDEAKRSVDSAAVASGDAAATAARLADAMSLSIFGAQPLLPLAADFRRQAADLRVVADDLGRLGTALARDRVQASRVRDEVRELARRVGAVGGDTGVGGMAALIGALLLWLAAQALVALVAGIALLRRRPHRAA